MGWQDELRPASWRGVPFEAMDVSGQVGREAVVSEFPESERWAVDDLGIKAPRLTLRAVISGDDYHRVRDRLLAALQVPGPGQLVHPTLGAMLCQVDGDCTYTERSDGGGAVEFDLPFVRAEEAVPPAATVDTAAAVELAATEVRATERERFAAAWVGTGERVVADAATSIQARATDLTTAVRAPLASTLAIRSDVDAAAATIVATAAVLTASPASLAEAFAAPIALLEDVQALLALAGASPPAEPTLDGTRGDTGRANDVSISRLCQRLALAHAAEVAAATSFEVADDALALRDRLVERLEAELDTDLPLGLYRQLATLRAKAWRDLTDRAATLPRLVTWQVPEVMPSLVIAHRLYGDATRADEIVQRNRIQRPAMVPPGPILVLSS